MPEQNTVCTATGPAGDHVHDARCGHAAAVPQGFSERRTGILLILTGCLPFAVGGAYAALDGSDSLPPICPFQVVTGLPCPLCGGTRAFAFASSGDIRFLSYNAFWVFVAIALVISGLLVLFTRVSFSGFWYRRGRLPVYLVGSAFVAGWIVALINRGTIVIS